MLGIALISPLLSRPFSASRMVIGFGSPRPSIVGLKYRDSDGGVGAGKMFC